LLITVFKKNPDFLNKEIERKGKYPPMTWYVISDHVAVLCKQSIIDCSLETILLFRYDLALLLLDV